MNRNMFTQESSIWEDHHACVSLEDTFLSWSCDLILACWEIGLISYIYQSINHHRVQDITGLLCNDLITFSGLIFIIKCNPGILKNSHQVI